MPESALKSMPVAAGFIWRNGRFLACQRPQGKPLAGYWELPGGKLETGETPQAALKRELREELNIGVCAARFFCMREHPYPAQGIRAILYFFEVLQFEGEPQPLENQKIAWIAPAKVLNLDFLPADMEVLQKLVAHG